VSYGPYRCYAWVSATARAAEVARVPQLRDGGGDAPDGAALRVRDGDEVEWDRAANQRCVR
jgi:hypothetical protein